MNIMEKVSSPNRLLKKVSDDLVLSKFPSTQTMRETKPIRHKLKKTMSYTSFNFRSKLGEKPESKRAGTPKAN
jgi:hypothetical protein